MISRTAIQIVPSVLPEQADPAVEQPVEQAVVPRYAGHARGGQGGVVVAVPAPEVGPAVPAIGRGGYLQDEEQPVVRLARHRQHATNVEGAKGRGGGLIAQGVVRARRPTQLVEPVDQGQLVGQRHPFEERGIVLSVGGERERDLLPDGAAREALANEVERAVKTARADGAHRPV